MNKSRYIVKNNLFEDTQLLKIESINQIFGASEASFFESVVFIHLGATQTAFSLSQLEHRWQKSSNFTKVQLGKPRSSVSLLTEHR